MRAMFVNYDEIPFVQGVHGAATSIKPLIVDKLGFSIIKWKGGAEVPLHEHDDEQIDYCLEGKVEWTIKDDSGEWKAIMTKGTVMAREPHVLHRLKFLEDSLAVEIFYPADKFLEYARKLGLVLSEKK